MSSGTFDVNRGLSVGLEYLPDPVQRAQKQTVETLARVMGKRDPYTYRHQQRVADLAVAIGVEMGLDRRRVEGLRLGARIHDIGKIQVPAEILNRPGTLAAPELEIIKSHSMAGAEIVDQCEFAWPIREIIIQHHERIDGSGYPLGIAGDEICVEARIVAVADVVEAMASHRPYRPALGISAALRTIESESGRRLDSRVVEVCTALFRDNGYVLEQ